MQHAVSHKGGAPDAEPPGIAHALHVMALLGVIAFLYFARPVVLPICLALIATMALQPLVRGLSSFHVPRRLSAAIVFCSLVGVVGAGFIQLERPAARWVNDVPQHMTELRMRVRQYFPKAQHLRQATAAVANLGATEAEKKEQQRVAPVFEVKDERGTSSILDWTSTFLAGLGETLVLTYMLLASGDLFRQKIVDVIPSIRGKVRAIEISREIQEKLSNYMFSVTVINVCLGALVSCGLYLIGVPNATMWGIFSALLNFVPYFGPICGVLVLAAVGLLTFDSPWQGLLPPLCYMAIHLLESNFVTPILLGRRLMLNPVAILVSLIFWVWLWGIPGALLSVPILVAIKVISDGVPSISYIGELIGR
jgi:predicted PurR-regulated permease PerM